MLFLTRACDSTIILNVFFKEQRTLQWTFSPFLLLRMSESSPKLLISGHTETGNQLLVGLSERSGWPLIIVSPWPETGDGVSLIMHH